MKVRLMGEPLFLITNKKWATNAPVSNPLSTKFMFMMKVNVVPLPYSLSATANVPHPHGG